MNGVNPSAALPSSERPCLFDEFLNVLGPISRFTAPSDGFYQKHTRATCWLTLRTTDAINETRQRTVSISTHRRADKKALTGLGAEYDE